MTEASPRRRARWTSAAVLAPGAAAVFGASVSWAASTVPVSSQPPPPANPATTTAQQTTQQAPQGTGNQLSEQARQWRAVAAQRRQVRHQLERELRSAQVQVVRLRVAEQQLAASMAQRAQQAQQAPVAGGAPALPPAPGPVGPAPGPVAAPPPAPVPAPAPPVVQAPPPVQAVTGSSGKP